MNYDNSICIDPSVMNDTYVWFRDGYMRVSGNFLEVSKKIYNLTTIKYVNKDGTENVVQNIKIYLDCAGIGIQLKDILETKYNLKIYKCNNYRKQLETKLYEQKIVYTDNRKKFEIEYECIW